MRSLEGMIFDMDGVLADSSDCHRTAFETVFRECGIDGFSYPGYAGRRTRDVVEEVLAEAGKLAPAGTVTEIAQEKSRLALEMFEREKPIAAGCERVLAEMAARCRMALASSGSRASVNAFLRLTGSATLFTSVLTGEDVRRAKPDPEIYLESARRLGLDPVQCVVVEDAVSGVRAARFAGAQVIGIPGTCSAGELSEAGADVIACLEGLVSKLPAAPAIERQQWTAVIPAAGRGSRLGFHRPKILYPVGGRPILDWLLDYLLPSCGRFIFVLSPEGEADVAAELEKRIPGQFEIAIQSSPTGMGDAVALALGKVVAPHVCMVWGDQVGLRRSSVEACLRLHQGPLHPDATVPTVLRLEPYIHFERDQAGKLSGVLQAREGAAMPRLGESDTGFFCFNPRKLEDWLRRMRQSGEAIGARTGEFNLLPVLALAAREGLVLTPRVVSEEETIGVNDARDAAAAEQFLSRTDAVHN